MHDRRAGETDRRVSKRGGRRQTDTWRTDVEAVRLRWEELEAAGGATGPDGGTFDDDDVPADYSSYLGRSPFPPRK